MSNVECVFNGFYKGLQVLKILQGDATCEICFTRCLQGKVRTEHIVYWRYRFTGGETESKDITKCILAIFR